MDPNKIRELASSFQKSRILLSGFELDIFTNIDEAGITSNQIADNLHLDKHGCERLLNALVSLGFLRKQNDLFFNTEESFTFLSKKSPGYLGGLMHSNHLWNTWSNLTRVVRTGVSANPSEINERGEDWLFPFINAMHDRAKTQAPQQLANIDLTGILHDFHVILPYVLLGCFILHILAALKHLYIDKDDIFQRITIKSSCKK